MKILNIFLIYFIRIANSLSSEWRTRWKSGSSRR